MSCLKFKRPGDGLCPCIKVSEGLYYIQSKSFTLLDVYVLRFQPSGGWLKDTGQTDEYKAQETASKLVEPGARLWWTWNGAGYTIEHNDGWRYYLFRALGPPFRWMLRCCHDEEVIMEQGMESYLEFVRECERYVNERHGQISLFE